MAGKTTVVQLAIASTAMFPAAAQAQAQAVDKPALADEVAQLRAEVEMLRAEIRAMRGEAQQAAVAAVQTPPPAAVLAPPSHVAAAPKPGPDATQIAWKGGPEFKTESGWSFKPRGRIQIDAGYLHAPGSRASGQADGRGITSRLRRAYLGAQGAMPGGFSYRLEVDLANNGVNMVDAFLAWDKGPFNITVGQHHPFTSMEQVESDLFLAFTERASFISAFNLERRLGASVGFRKGAVMANAGIFTDDVGALTNDGDKSFSIDGRLIWMPKFGDAQLHAAGSAHRRKLSRFQAGLGVQYRARPYIGTTDIRYVDTGLLTVDNETHYGAEAAAIWKRFHAVGEAAWLKVNRRGDADPNFFGGYAEAGVYLTNDTRTYKNGQFDRTVPTRPLGDGGFGALELNGRYDHLDLTSSGIGGGVQDAFGASFVWTPTAYVRFTADYVHLIYDIPSQQPKFNADVIGVRGQVDF